MIHGSISLKDFVVMVNKRTHRYAQAVGRMPVKVHLLTDRIKVKGRLHEKPVIIGIGEQVLTSVLPRSIIVFT